MEFGFEDQKINYPRIEDSLFIMAVGIDKRLDNALKIATSNMLDWLQTDYDLSLQEATQVISTSIEYTIAEIADPEVEVVSKIRKTILNGLERDADDRLPPATPGRVESGHGIVE